MADYDAASKAAEVAQGCRCVWTSGVVGRQVIWRRMLGCEPCPRHDTAANRLNALDETVVPLDASELPRWAVIEPVEVERTAAGNWLRDSQSIEPVAGATVIADRQATHGDFAVTARIAEALRAEMQDMPNWLLMRDVQRSALGMMAVKIGRIGSGDADCIDHWRDLAGYAQLVVADLEARAERGQ